jgi:hypothetical protein
LNYLNGLGIACSSMIVCSKLGEVIRKRRCKKLNSTGIKLLGFSKHIGKVENNKFKFFMSFKDLIRQM